MAKNTKEALRTFLNMVLVKSHFQMVIDTKENTFKGQQMEQEVIFGRMALSIKVIFLKE